MSSPEIRLNSRLLPILTLLLAIVQLLYPSRVWTILLVGFGGAWLIGYLWARSLQRHVRLAREMRFGWSQVGDQLQERFTLVNDGWAPGVWVEIADHSNVPGYQTSRVTCVDPHSTTQWRTEGICTRRGLYTLGPATAITGDPLGVYTVHLRQPASSALLVTPPVVPLPGIAIAPGGRVGEGRRLRTDAVEQTVIAAGVRDYRPGDHPRWIHWPTSMRRDVLSVRQFDSSPASDWWIFLDLDRRVQIGAGWDSTGEHGIVLAASLADRGLRAGAAVGLVTHGEELVWLPPQRAQAQQLAILRALATVSDGPRSLAGLLERARPAFRRGASLILITPAVEGDWIAALFPLLRSGVTPTVLLLDPISFGGTGDTRKTLALLADLGVARYRITRDLLDQPEARPGRQGRWEWRIMGTGRAVPVHQPADVAWQRLS